MSKFSPFDLVVRRIFDRVETTSMDFIPIPREEAQALLQGIRDLKARARPKEVAWNGGYNPKRGDLVRFTYESWLKTHPELVVIFHSIEPAHEDTVATLG